MPLSDSAAAPIGAMLANIDGSLAALFPRPTEGLKAEFRAFADALQAEGEPAQDQPLAIAPAADPVAALLVYIDDTVEALFPTPSATLTAEFWALTGATLAEAERAHV